ncbi:MAG: hypothetical protein HY699_19265 [Deltaproteobacteria bacterium]|nr:hypothetical protein [Deltaproteobacteria bacterium]
MLFSQRPRYLRSVAHQAVALLLACGLSAASHGAIVNELARQLVTEHTGCCAHRCRCNDRSSSATHRLRCHCQAQPAARRGPSGVTLAAAYTCGHSEPLAVSFAPRFVPPALLVAPLTEAAMPAQAVVLERFADIAFPPPDPPPRRPA